MKAKKNRVIPIWMILGGLIVLYRYLRNWDASQDNTYYIILILGVTIYISIAAYALLKSITTPDNPKE